MNKDDMLKLDNQLCYLIYACSRGITKLYKPLLKPLKLTYPQYLVLLVLWENDGIPVKELGHRLNLDSGTLTPLLKRLESDRIISRKRSSTDERIVLIHLTDKGLRLKQKADGIPEALLCRSNLSIEAFQKLRGDMKYLLGQIQNSAIEDDECTPG